MVRSGVAFSKAQSFPSPMRCVEHRVNLRNANEMTLPFFLLQLRFVKFNALLDSPPATEGSGCR